MELLGIALALIPTGILGYLLHQKDKQLGSILDASTAAQAEAYIHASRERATLIAQIQRPDLSPTIAATPEDLEPVPHIALDDDEAMAEYRESVQLGELS